MVIANDRDNEQHLVWCAPCAACLRLLRHAGWVPACCARRRCRCAASDTALRGARFGARRPNPALFRCRLVDLKNIYAKQLPNMPKDYIVRLVFDRGHKSLIAVKARALVAATPCHRVLPADAAAQSGVIVGGITYRLFGRQQLAEIAFCAVSAVEQVKGYGTRLMDKLKGYVTKEEGCTHLITFADNNAVGYFQKQARGAVARMHLCASRRCVLPLTSHARRRASRRKF